MKLFAVLRACLAIFAMSMLAACSKSTDPKLPKPTVTIAVQPTDIVRGDTVAIKWSSTDATSCVASGEWGGPRSTSGSEELPTRFAGKLLYTLTCTGPGGSAESTASVVSHRGVSAP